MLLINPEIKTFDCGVNDQFALSSLLIRKRAPSLLKRRKKWDVYLNSAISWFLSDGRSKKNNKLEGFKWKGCRAERRRDHVVNNVFCKCRGEIMHEYQISMIGRWTACLTTAESKLEITWLRTGIQYYIPIEKGMLCECSQQKGSGGILHL